MSEPPFLQGWRDMQAAGWFQGCLWVRGGDLQGMQPLGSSVHTGVVLSCSCRRCVPMCPRQHPHLDASLTALLWEMQVGWLRRGPPSRG